MMEGYIQMGNMISCKQRFSEELIKEIRMELETAGNCREGNGDITGGNNEGGSRDISGGISRMDGGVIVLRIFGMRSDDIIRSFDRIYDRIMVMMQ